MSGIGIVETPQSYCAHLYYTRKQMYEWRFYFAITPDLEATNMVVREHYGHDAMQVTMLVRFEHSEITLNIPEEGLVTKEGWKITPLTTPTISRKEVDEYKPGHHIPECQLIVQWPKEDQRPVPLRHIVDLIGAKPPFNYIHLNLNPAMEGFSQVGQQMPTSITSASEPIQPALGSKYAGLESKPELSDLMNEVASKVPAKWKQISIQLGLTPSDQECFMALSPNDPLQCFTSVFRVWKNRETRPYTWSTVIEALESPAVDEKRLAQELRTRLQSEWDSGEQIIRTPLKRSFRVEPVQPVLPASRQTINSELGQRELLPQSSGQAFDSQQQQQQQSLESSRQAFDSGLRHHPQQQSSTESEAACQTQQEEEEEEGYCAQLYITRRLVTEWKVDFVVTKDLDSCSTVVKKKYISHGQPQFSFIFCFKEDFVSLKIPEKKELGGWEITSIYDPKITRWQVNHFSSGKSIPKCELILHWSKDSPPACLRCKIGLIGTHDHDHFLLHIDPGSYHLAMSAPLDHHTYFQPPAALGSKYTGLESKPELSDLMNEVASKVSAKWKQISIQLGLTPSDQECFIASTPNDPLQCFTSVFRVWKSRATRPYTWFTMIEALESPAVDEMRLAQELRTKLHLVGALEDQLHYEAYQQALKEGVKISLKYVKFLFFGPPQTGKTSLRRRLVGEIQNLEKEPVQASTGTAEHYDVIVKPVEDKITTSTTVITKSEWSTVKALFGKDINNHETDLDEELRILYQFIYGNFPPSEKRSSDIPPDVMDEATTGQSPTVQEKSHIVVQTNPNTHEIDSSTSTLQQVSSDRGPRYELDAREMEEIEKAFVAFDKVLCTPRQEQLKVLLDKTILVNMVDTGGQPAFLEMLPALTISPALYLIFFRLNQELNKRYNVQYVSEADEKIQLGESSYTVEEVIFQALSSIAFFSCAVPKQANMPNPSHAAMLIGTHKDQLGSDPESEIKAKDDALRKSLVEILESDLLKSDKNLLRYASDDQLMFAVDNMTGDEGELENVRKRLENIIKQEFDDWPIPASWLMFSIFLRKMGRRTMSLSQCHEIGNRLNVKNTDEALWFLHHCVGILMYFPEIEEIKDIVICDPQVVFDSVTNLILNSFTFEQVSKHACDKFKEAGQFRFKDIQKIAKHMKSDGLSLPKLVKLLEYHNIIAPISSSLPLSPGLRTQSYQEENMVYFMPAVLRVASKEELHMKQSSRDPAPLMINFKCGFVPIGVFCATLASLVVQKDILGWILQEPCQNRSQDNHILCKNKATFRINAAYDVTLVSKAKRYEIHITCFSTAVTDKATLIEYCGHVLETVCDTLDQVISKMKYKPSLISPSSDQNVYELGFKCPVHPDSDHLVINRPKKGGLKPPSLSAKLLWFSYQERKSIMVCLEEEKQIAFAETSLLVWFEKAPSLLLGSTPDSQPPKPELKYLMPLQVSDWHRLGLALGLKSDDLNIIEKDFRGDTRKQTCKMFELWLRTQPDASYEQLIKALHEVGDKTVANSLCNKYGISLPLPAAKIYARSQVDQSTMTGGNIEQMLYSECGAEIQSPQLVFGAAHGAVQLRSRSSAKNWLRSHSPTHSGSSRIHSMSQSSKSWSATAPSHCAKAMLVIFIIICIVLLCLLIKLSY